MAKIALLIGISDYEAGLNPLPTAVRDVAAMTEVLTQPELGGFLRENITVLTNASASDIREAIETVFAERDKGDLVLLYFSGHGIKDETGNLYLGACNTQKNLRGQLKRATAVECRFIHDMMSESRSKQQIIILDCCFSGAFAQGMTAKDSGVVDVKGQLHHAVEGRAVLTSSTSTQYSFEEKQASLGVYTRYLIEGIQTGAADGNDDGEISVDELHEYARQRIKETFPQLKPELYAVREGYKLVVAKSHIRDPESNYRKAIEAALSRWGTLTPADRKALESRRAKLALPPERAQAIEAETLQLYRQQEARRLRQRRQWAIAGAVLLAVGGAVTYALRPTPSGEPSVQPSVQSPFLAVTRMSQITDVQPTDWVYQALQSLVERYGVTPQVYRDGTFRPRNQIRRDELVDYLAIALDQMNALKASLDSPACAVPETPPFPFNPPSDVTPESSWYYAQYKTLTEATGLGNVAPEGSLVLPDGRFHGDFYSKRAEVAVGLNRLLDGLLLHTLQPDQSGVPASGVGVATRSPILLPVLSPALSSPRSPTVMVSATLPWLAQVTSVSQLRDVDPRATYYADVQSLVERYGVLSGYPDGTFRPDELVTRESFVAQLNAALDRAVEIIATVCTSP